MKAWGPPGIVCVIIWYLMWKMVDKSEQREAKKDLRIQYLENQLIENYGERIAAADSLNTALIEVGKALEVLTREVMRNGK